MIGPIVPSNGPGVAGFDVGEDVEAAGSDAGDGDDDGGDDAGEDVVDAAVPVPSEHPAAVMTNAAATR
jgi:hypothetical protein